MKNIKKYLIVTIALMSISCTGQERNYLTFNEYNNILVDGVTWQNIYETNGDIAKMKILFNNSINYETGNEPNPSIGFWDKGYYFGFENRSDDGNYYLIDFWIDNNTSNTTIKGITFTIGDNISKLGDIKVNTYKDGSKGVIYQENNSDSSGLFIMINPTTNKIIEIKYTDFD